MVASFVLAVATTVASPAPATCAALNDTIIPIGTVLRKNDEAFEGMASRLQQIFGSLSNQGSAPSNQELMEQGDSHDSVAGTKNNEISFDPGNQQDQFYSPSQVVKASQIDSMANSVNVNLSIASKVLDKSLGEVPQGVDPLTDEMRARAQSVIALQHSFAGNYQSFVNTYVTNQNTAWTLNVDQRAFVDAYLRALLTGQGANDRSLNGGERAQIASIAGVIQDLQQGEHAFGVDLLSTYNQCNSMHGAAGAPSPKP